MKNIHSLVLLSIVIILSSCASRREATRINTNNFSTNTSSNTAKGRDAYETYVLAYYPWAVEQMHRHRIPASIKLAQGLLESGAGRSTLTQKSNNHFGIKASKDWNGKKTSSMDNGVLSYFRVYPSARESYEDHSMFLVGRTRYANLFKLKHTDYKGWSHGLKKAGYAEDPAYPQKLISLIQRYELHKYDDYSMRDISSATKFSNYPGNNGNAKRETYLSMGLLYVIADTGDTFKSLSKETGVSRSKLISYNDLYKNYPLKAGDIIYLEKKRSKASKESRFHTTTGSESLYSISQKYGIRLKSLYKLNPAYNGYATLKVGDIIRLR